MNKRGVITIVLIVAVAVVMCSMAMAVSPLVGQQPRTDKDQAVQNHSPVAPSGTAISWASARVRGLEERIETEKRARVEHDLIYLRTEEALSEALSQKFSKAELHQLAASFDSSPLKWEDSTIYQNTVQDSLLGTFLAAGDRDGLVTLLSARCPPEVLAHLDIELLLVLRGQKLKDPILILGEAYSRARAPETRKEIVAALRRGFGAYGIRGRDDTEFVANVMAWYRLHHDQLMVNETYGDNFNDSLVGGDRYGKNPLFVRKAKRQESRTGQGPEHGT
jgi:hypothetical protein